MKSENPFRDWLEADTYGGTWIPVAGLGGWLGPASLPVLFANGNERELLASSDWPIQFRDAAPQVWETVEGEKHAHLEPELERSGVALHPLAVFFRPPGRRAWLEPVQSFVLYSGAAPRQRGSGRIVWEIPDEDGRPDEMARWIPGTEDDFNGVLEIRRDALFDFLRDFDFDLAVFFEENRGDNSVPDGWRDEDQEELRSWRCWASDVMNGDIRVVLRCVTVIRRPPALTEEERRHGQTLDYPIGTNRDTGEPILASYPGGTLPQTTWEGAGRDNFLTPVFFKREVLDVYLSDPRFYTVSEVQVSAGEMWSIPIAITERGNVQVWLGDLGRISDRAQRHWQQFAIADDDELPEWRFRQDLGAEFVDPPGDEGVQRVKAALSECNEAAEAAFDVPMFSEVDGLSAQRIETLHTPLNDSAPAFQHQVTSLAILLVDSLNPEFLKAANAPEDGGGLSRLAGWLEQTFGLAPDDAKDEIGGLFAVLAIRSSGGGAHRAGSRAPEVLERAGIDLDNLSEGFEKLAQLAADSLVRVCDRLRSLPSRSPAGPAS
jgi:hypothetical protein